MKIEGQVAIVTGAGAEGTGRAIALALACRGASVAVADIDPLGGRETVDRIEAAGGRAAHDRGGDCDHPRRGSESIGHREGVVPVRTYSFLNRESRKIS